MPRDLEEIAAFSKLKKPVTNRDEFEAFKLLIKAKITKKNTTNLHVGRGVLGRPWIFDFKVQSICIIWRLEGLKPVAL